MTKIHLRQSSRTNWDLVTEKGVVLGRRENVFSKKDAKEWAVIFLSSFNQVMLVDEPYKEDKLDKKKAIDSMCFNSEKAPLELKSNARKTLNEGVQKSKKKGVLPQKIVTQKSLSEE